MKDTDWIAIKRFNEIIKSRNINKAEQNLKLKATSIYKTLSHLEKIFDSPLIEKYRKGDFIPTKLGLILLEELDKSNKHIENLRGKKFIKQKELFIAASATVGNYVLGFHLKNIIQNLKLKHLKLRFYPETNPIEALIDADILIYNEITKPKNVASRDLGNLIYKLYYCPSSGYNVMQDIKNKQQIRYIGCNQSSCVLSDLDTFTINNLKYLTGVLPKCIIDTNSSMNEYVACQLGLGVACLCSQSPLIKTYNLHSIDDKIFKVPQIAYFKHDKAAILQTALSILGKIFK